MLRRLYDRFITPRVVLVIGWAWAIAYAYPGYMSYDSVYQLSQARRIDPITEWHPPLMTMIWRYADHIIAGPFPMLVIQSATLLCALYVVLKRFLAPRAAAIAAVVLYLYPMNLIVMSVIWKDCQMAAFMMASIACFLSTNRKWRITGCVFLFLATAMRYNAAAATLPIFLLLWDRSDRAWLKRYGAAVGLWVLVTVLAFVINGALVEKKTYPWQVGSAPVDIVGTLRYARHYDDAELIRDLPGVKWQYPDKLQIRMRTYYDPNHSFLDVTMENGQGVFVYPMTAEERAGFSAGWKTMVTRHPIAFLRHRWGVFVAQLTIRVQVWAAFSNADWGEDLLKHRANYSALQRRWVHYSREFVHTPLGKVWIYFVMSLIFLPLARRHRLPALFFISGIFHQLGLFLVAPATDYRYSHWTVLCAVLGIVLLFIERRRRGLLAGDELLPRATSPTPP